jgi:uncharacterized protein (TIGR03663 family)
MLDTSNAKVPACKRNYNYIYIMTLIVILCAAIFLRVYSITDRPMHSDEGVNYHFVKEMMVEGYYHYSYKNYHGPSYFYFLYWVHSFFGSEELQHRMPAIISGVMVVLAPLLLKGVVSLGSLFTPMIFLALSSSLVFYSRYSIHEMLLVFASLWFLFSSLRWLERKEESMLIHIGMSLALLISTKETFIIFGFALFVSIFTLYSPRYVFSLLIQHWFYFLWGFFFFILITIAFFSGFFQHSEGLRELVMGVEQWIGRGYSDKGHQKPYYYYANMIKTAEPLVFLVILPFLLYVFLGLKKIYFLFHREGFKIKTLIRVPSVWYGSFDSSIDRIIFGSALVSLITFVVYSYVPYKTPWLIVNSTAPALFSFGLFFSMISRRRNIFLLLMGSFSVISLWYALKYNFMNDSLSRYIQPIVSSVGTYSNENPYSYVQTTGGMVEVVNDIVAYLEKNPDGEVLLSVKIYWPLPYYLREYARNISYAKYSRSENDYSKYGIMVLNKSVDIEDPLWDKKYFRLSGVQESQVYYNKEKFY